MINYIAAQIYIYNCLCKLIGEFLIEWDDNTWTGPVHVLIS